MLSVDLLGRTPEQFKALSKQKVVAVYSFRFDKHLVPDLLVNLDGVVDGFIAFDDTESDEVFSSEPARRAILVKKAIEIGADWIFAVDPDERFEPALCDRMPELTSVRAPTVWSFAFRELYETTAYRSDGIWNQKRVVRLFPINSQTRFGDKDLHGEWIHVNKNYSRRNSGINLYHLKSINPNRRKGRRDLYASLDPDRKLNAPGYDYLVDEAGLELTKIPDSRMYSPVHVDDGELWMSRVTNVQDDPPSLTLKRAENLRKSGNVSDAAKLVEKSSMHLPEGQERHLYTAREQFRLGAYTDASAQYDIASKDISTMSVEDHVKMIECANILDQENIGDFVDKLILNHANTPEAELAILRQTPPIRETKMIDAFTSFGWVEEDVAVTWGETAHYNADIATIVIGLNAPTELRAAVASLLEQSVDTLVVVVNSGSGNLEILLEDMLDRIIIAEAPSQIYVGAARNIGASLVASKYVAFLASDCLAEQRSVENRVKHHENGHPLVSSSLANSHPNSAFAWAYHFALYAYRLSDTKPDSQQSYGLSYERGLFFSHGWFPYKLRVAEDTAFNSYVRQSRQSIFARDVLTTHRAETRFFRIMVEMFERGQRSVQYSPMLSKTELKAINLRLPLQMVRIVVNSPMRRLRFQLDARRGLPPPEQKNASIIGLYLSYFCFLSNDLGRISQLHRELSARSKAYKLLKKCQQKESVAPLELIKSVRSDGYLGQIVINQLSNALYAAGYDDKRAFQDR